MAGIIITAIFAVLLAVIIWRSENEKTEREAQWVLERRELLNRIQAPERAPFAEPQFLEIPEQAPDEWNLVGSIAPPPAEEAE